MKITVCKEVKYKPSGITSMCPFNDLIIVFRKNSTMEFVRNITYYSFFYLELPSPVIQSTMLLDKKCLVLGEDSCLRVIDLETCEITKLDTEYSIVCFEKDYKPNTFLHCFAKNGLLITLDLKTKLEFKIIRKCSRTITCILKEDFILLGDKKGQVSSLDLNGKLLNELEISKSPITSLLHISDNKYAALCGSGELIYFDVKINTIIQRIKVREHALYCGVFQNESLHLSGVDGRIVSYKLTEKLFQRSYQADRHVLEVKNMCSIGDTIYTGGKDGIVGIFIPNETRYKCFRVFDSTPKGKFISKGLNNNLVIVNNVAFIEIFKLEEALKNTNTLETAYKTTIRLDKKYLEDLSVKGIKFSNQCRIYFENNVYCYDTDGNILVYSDNKATKLLELTPKVDHDTYFCFPPSKYICITPELIVLHLIDKTIKIIDRKNYSNFDQLISTDFDEEIKVIDGQIFFKKSKKVYNIVEKTEDMNFIKNVDGFIIDILKINKKIVLLTKKDVVVYALYKKTFNDKNDNDKNDNDKNNNRNNNDRNNDKNNNETCSHFSTYDILTGIIKHNQEVFYTTVSSITSVKTGTTYDLGSVIYSSGSLETSLVVLKDDWAYLQNEIGDKINKNKWKTR